jgi:hypothetical protein
MYNVSVCVCVCIYIYIIYLKFIFMYLKILQKRRGTYEIGTTQKPSSWKEDNDDTKNFSYIRERLSTLIKYLNSP